MHDAFSAALQRWPVEGLPANPRAWLISTARFKAIDAIRRRTRFDASQDPIADALYGDEPIAGAVGDELPDDPLKLIFTCCHPALAPDACAALTLREVCGLTTEEIARAFLTSAPTIAQRIVRAKARIRDERIPYQVPSGAELPNGSPQCSPWCTSCSTKAMPRRRVHSPHACVDLSAEQPSGSAACCSSCCRSRRSSASLQLMLLHTRSRRPARVSADGELVRCSSTRTARRGITLSAAKVSRWWSAPCRRDASDLIRCKPPSPRSTPRRVRQRSPTGGRFARCTMRYLRCSPRLSSSLTAPRLSRCTRGPQPGWRSSMHSSHAVSCVITSSRIRHAPTCFVGLDDVTRRGAAYRQARALAKSDPEIRFLEKRLRELG